MLSIYTFIFIVLCVRNVHGLSTYDRIDHMKYHKFYEESAQPFRDCRDSNETACKDKEHLCGHHTETDKECKRTCGHCPAVSPRSCKASQYGCCWDNLTRAGKGGTGCPACDDMTPYCPKYYDNCHIGHIRRMCPITCEVQYCIEFNAKCFDDAKQASFCPIFQMSGFCEIDPELMKIYCNKTCGMCDIDKVPKVEIDAMKHRGINPPRETEDKINLLTHIKEQEKKKESVSIHSEEDDTKLQELLEEEAAIQKKRSPSNTKVSQDKGADDDILNLLEEVTKKSMKNHLMEKVEMMSDTLKEDDVPKKGGKTVAALERISLVKKELEKRTEDLLNDLIQDTLAQQPIKKKEIKEPKQAGDKRDIAELEANLLDMLLKERSKKSP